MIWNVIAGAALGAWGAQRNGVRFADERLLWLLGGSLSAWVAWALGFFPIWAVLSLFASALTPRLDASRSRAPWLTSFLLKAVQCPLTTSLGFLAAVIVRRGKPRLFLRRGACYALAGEGRSALALGGMVLARREMFDGDGEPPEWLVRHESFHTRNAACLGEAGFYLLYVTLGAAWGLARRAPWNGLAKSGRGNPFERTAHLVGGAQNLPRA